MSTLLTLWQVTIVMIATVMTPVITVTIMIVIACDIGSGSDGGDVTLVAVEIVGTTDIGNGGDQ